VLWILLATATSAFALEKTPARLDDGGERRDWDGPINVSCSIAYYNICTGWIWVWSGWAANSVIGTVYESCCPSGLSVECPLAWRYYVTGAPANYGFTGSAAIVLVDANDCPTTMVTQQPFLPASGWNYLTYTSSNFAPSRFAEVHTLADDNGLGTPVTLATDGAGWACGVCFSTTRTTSSYTWGTTGSPLCPGFAMNDGACNVEWLAVSFPFCQVCTGVEDDSWGSIKALYR
jgi:hypothetical protein